MMHARVEGVAGRELGAFNFLDESNFSDGKLSGCVAGPQRRGFSSASRPRRVPSIYDGVVEFAIRSILPIDARISAKSGAAPKIIAVMFS